MVDCPTDMVSMAVESIDYFYYEDEIRPYVRASKVCYVDRVLL